MQDPAKLPRNKQKAYWAEHNKKMKMAITGLKSSLSSVWRCAGINHKWSWTNDAHTEGTGNPTLSDEINLLKHQTKRQDVEAGKTRKQAAVIEPQDFAALQRKVTYL